VEQDAVLIAQEPLVQGLTNERLIVEITAEVSHQLLLVFITQASAQDAKHTFINTQVNNNSLGSHQASRTHVPILLIHIKPSLTHALSHGPPASLQLHYCTRTLNSASSPSSKPTATRKSPQTLVMPSVLEGAEPCIQLGTTLEMQ
jgi:hypothetical protein